MQLIIFALDQQQFALRLNAVERIALAVEISALPKAPEIVDGIINVRGRIMPVVNVRRRFDLPEREISLTDKLILAHTARRPVCLVADAVTGVGEYPEQSIAQAETILPHIDYIDGVVKLPDGLVLIHDLDRFLTLEEEASLDQALA